MVNAETLIIYTHPDCEYSAAAKLEFDEQGIGYEEIDVTQVSGATDDLERLTGGERITPVIIEGDRVTVGYMGVG